MFNDLLAKFSVYLVTLQYTKMSLCKDICERKKG